MVDYSDFSLGKKKDNIKINIDDIKGGIKSDAIEKDLYSIFKDAVNTDNNNILDREETDNFITEIKTFAKDNNFSLNEAAKYLKAKNLQNINPEKLFQFIQNLSQASENIEESSVITNADGKKTFFIKYKDTSEETIYPDNTSKLAYNGLKNEKITINKNSAGEKISEIIVYEDKSKRSTSFENNLPKEETFEKDGVITTTTFEGGSQKNRTIKSGETVQTFKYINGQEKLTYSKKFEDKKWIEETNTYNEEGKITKSIVSAKRPNSDRTDTTTTNYKYHDNGQISEILSEKLETDKDGYRKEILTKTFDNSGKRLKLTTSYEDKYDYEYSHSDEMNYDQNGNIVGYVPQNATLNSILKDLGIEKDSQIYEKFIELNKDNIKSFNKGKVQGFDVGAKIIIPGEVEENALRYTKINPKDEKENYERENMGHADVQAVPTGLITVEKDTTWWELARQNLIDLGNKKPTHAQIAENMNLLVTLNNAIWNINDPVKKGHSVTVPAKESANKPDYLKLSYYRLENLKKNYPSDKYRIERVRTNPGTNDWGGENAPIWAYHVYDKSTGKKILSVFPKDENLLNEIKVQHYNNGYLTKELDFDYEGNITETLYSDKRNTFNSYDKQGVLTKTEYTEGNKHVTIKNPKSPNKGIQIEQNGKFESYKYKNGKLYSKTVPNKEIRYNKQGKHEFTINWKNGYKNVTVDYPKVNEFYKNLQQGNSETLKEIVKNIDKDNCKYLFLAYSNKFGKDLLKDIESSKLDNTTKEELIKHFRNLINEENKITVKQRQSQVSNNGFKGDPYSVKLDGEILTVRNQKTGKVSKIDFTKMLADCNSWEYARLKKLITENIPGEVLEDMSIELTKVTVASDMNLLKDNPDFEASGVYHPKDDSICLTALEIYSISAEDFVTEDIIVKAFVDTIVHETGHALDWNGYLNNSPSSKGKFKAVFEKELENYKKSGKKQFEYKQGFKETTEFKDGNLDSNTSYATANAHEMFAECYTLLMTGDNQSKDHILKYFPTTLKAAADLIKEIRQKSDTERQNPIHF